MELLIVFVCLSYIVDYLYTTGRTYFSPLGYDVEHVYKVELGEVSPQSTAYDNQITDSMHHEHLVQVLTRIRTYPGIEGVSVSKGSHPYNSSTSNGIRGIDTIWVHGYTFQVSPEFFRVFRITDLNGQTEPLITAAREEKSDVASAEEMRKFAKEGYTLLHSGVKWYMDTIPTRTVRAICNDIRFNDFEEVYPAHYSCYPENRLLARYAEICFRVRPEADSPEFAGRFRKEMKQQLRLGNIYLMDVTSFDDIRTSYYRGNGLINEVKIHLAGLSFLLLNILLGVIGTFWIRTQQRRSEVGVRIAMGATRGSVRSWLLVEGIMLLLLAALPALIIDWNIAYSLVDNFMRDDQFMWERFLVGQGLTLLFMAMMILIGVYLPARQVMKIQPAEALHDE